MDDPVPQFLAEHPELISITEAIGQYFRKEPVTSHCLKCGELLTVTAIEAIDTLWVTCSNGCSMYRVVYKRGTLSDKLIG
jgi:hypothetical protein